MKISTLISMSFLLFLINSCGNPQKKINNDSDTLTNGETLGLGNLYDVSLIRLISSPKVYDGKKVRVIGYLRLEFEGNELYLNKEDYDMRISKNAIWVDVPMKHPEGSSLIKFSNHYVIVEGTFDSTHNGHMSANSGSLKNIARLEIWEKMTDTIGKVK